MFKEVFQLASHKHNTATDASYLPSLAALSPCHHDGCDLDAVMVGCQVQSLSNTGPQLKFGPSRIEGLRFKSSGLSPEPTDHSGQIGTPTRTRSEIRNCSRRYVCGVKPGLGVRGIAGALNICMLLETIFVPYIQYSHYHTLEISN